MKAQNKRLLILKIRNIKTRSEFDEEYDADNVTDPSNFGFRNPRKISIKSLNEAKVWAEKVIAWFNDTCAPNEAHRELIDVILDKPQQGD